MLYQTVMSRKPKKRGSIVRIDYATRDYAEGTGAKRTNTAYVYLPYGYNESQRYNILYFVHGHYSTATSTFEDENGVVRKLLDQMIAHGDIDPMIVVTPSYNYGQPTPDYVDAAPYCRALPIELVNDLIPAVEAVTTRMRKQPTGRVLKYHAVTVPSEVFQWEQSPLGMPLMKH